MPGADSWLQSLCFAAAGRRLPFQSDATGCCKGRSQPDAEREIAHLMVVGFAPKGQTEGAAVCMGGTRKGTRRRARRAIGTSDPHPWQPLAEASICLGRRQAVPAKALPGACAHSGSNGRNSSFWLLLAYPGLPIRTRMARGPPGPAHAPFSGKGKLPEKVRKILHIAPKESAGRC